jgi:hypothetical protein
MPRCCFALRATSSTDHRARRLSKHEAGAQTDGHHRIPLRLRALLLQVPGPALSETAMSTLQHALTRGLEVVFQLEEGEILTEPVPARDRRRGILFFEATEGGAGVLGRLASDPPGLSQVARAALELMHCDNIDAAMAAAAPDVLTEVSDARCIAGCRQVLPWKHRATSAFAVSEVCSVNISRPCPDVLDWSVHDPGCVKTRRCGEQIE